MGCGFSGYFLAFAFTLQTSFLFFQAAFIVFFTVFPSHKSCSCIILSFIIIFSHLFFVPRSRCSCFLTALIFFLLPFLARIRCCDFCFWLFYYIARCHFFSFSVFYSVVVLYFLYCLLFISFRVFLTFFPLMQIAYFSTDRCITFKLSKFSVVLYQYEASVRDYFPCPFYPILLCVSFFFL